MNDAGRSQNEGVEETRAQLLQGLQNAGISRLEADQVVALYLQQQSISSPPPLPPRSTTIEGESSTI